VTPRLSETTVRWLDGLPRHGNPVGAVWNRLAELEAAGQDDRLITALRSVLVRHQPPHYGRCLDGRCLDGRCLACPRATWRKLWRRPSWPCMVWKRVHRPAERWRGSHARPIADPCHAETGVPVAAVDVDVDTEG
jgi:hypothetical protein